MGYVTSFWKRENRYCLHTQRKIPALSHTRLDEPGQGSRMARPRARARTHTHTHTTLAALLGPWVSTSPQHWRQA